MLFSLVKKSSDTRLRDRPAPIDPFLVSLDTLPPFGAGPGAFP